MFLLEPEHAGDPQDLVYSASDLVIAAQCEYQLLRKLDECLGRTPKVVFAADDMLERAAKLGDVHEHRVLERYLADFGPWNPAAGTGVYNVVPATSMDRRTLQAKHAESIAALTNGADVVFQAAFFDGTFHGRADFLVRSPRRTDDGAGTYPGDGAGTPCAAIGAGRGVGRGATDHPDPGTTDAAATYAVFDTKLARHAKVTALLQLAAYGDQLLNAGITPSPVVTLLLGDGRHSDHPLADVLPVFRERRRHFLGITAEHRADPGPVGWGDSRYTACGRCDYCAEQVRLHRDLLMVAGMTLNRRRKLMDAGIAGIDQLAAMTDDGGAGPDPTTVRLREQARLQTGTAVPDGTVAYPGPDGTPREISYTVLPDNTLGRLPEPCPGDIFFDFEGDPLWQDPATGKWGLEYLFGVLENPESPGGEPVFRPIWAHGRGEERHAFLDFLAYVAERRAVFPLLRIYHYAPYEKTALRHLSLIHVVGEDAVDGLLRDGILVDLYETVRHSLRISAESYSIKKLEPLYMGSHLRSGDVTDAGASVVAYADYCDARDAGDPERADRILAGISDYNKYDCLSTLELRNWLLRLAAERGIRSAPARTAPLETEQPGPSPEEARLLDYVAARSATLAGAALTAEDQAIAMVAAAVGYHRREDKQFWWGHFDRLNQPVPDWADTRDVFIVDRAEVLQDWGKPTARSNAVRTLRLTGRMADGSGFAPGKTFFRMYEPPFPQALQQSDDGTNGRAGWFSTEVLEVEHRSDADILVVTEKLRKGADEHADFPVALTPDSPIATRGQKDALSELAARVGSALPGLPKHPALDLLCRAAPRLSTLPVLPPVAAGPDGYADAITAAVADLDRSYLAVQGPPGTGKTHVGSHVIANLVARGWKVGVVGQSHAVVENMLRAAIDKAGVPADRVAKRPTDPRAAVPWAGKSDDAAAELLTTPGGALIGGTAWTMTGARIPENALDLLVIDEAGQFSLANTMAVSRAAKRLLLLGDPQQLPQVTQGTHPEPVDESALGWLSRGAHTLSADLGYFLATSWRMHPQLCAAVSELSYDGRLGSAPAASQRHLTGTPAGLSCSYVEHSGNSTSSPEEAAEVVRQVRAHLGLGWLDPKHGGQERPLQQQDLLVVAAYNAQVQLIQHELRLAGLADVRVGTVDRFQGQEAPVVIVSMAASAAGDVPRGMEFLLSRNRINVAVSRGQWRAVIVRSPALTNYLPVHPEGLEQLGGFIGLCDRARPDANGSRHVRALSSV
ncbi:TM0106 family RecB-like putative nuclease [Paenarthrobacter sp. PH39-S1]|uniref:TM0106 family RecB-like putative nuclease n=1 Tax=Paenarthrobacter sp. PH39-S1 TaxID=3046204 RepID=UPI0024B948AF|nr:TM0106 family RecB-like putative nuclease [Paenarthrobacter sp. PH39-S1]MDJ0355741.1 TM0106 family RecB-like putative nuclease [Paenarthrobacter sp. PH39-S1]